MPQNFDDDIQCIPKSETIKQEKSDLDLGDQKLIETKLFKICDISHELWREYFWEGQAYRIINPKLLYLKPGSSFHRVLDSKGIVHLIPAPGYLGCAVRWKSDESGLPIRF